ncbi:hypothetical protein, partial [Pantoea vagans]|uniref:hypothetical protein n=1 Tax=Pantoea vagans TaxID=470934 RepID=UPI003FA39D68
LRDIPVARPEIPHPLSGSDGLPNPPRLSLLSVLGTLSLWVFGCGCGCGFLAVAVAVAVGFGLWLWLWLWLSVQQTTQHHS